MPDFIAGGAIIFRYRDLSSLDILVELLDGFDAADYRCYGGVMQYPGNRELGQGAPVPFGDFLEAGYSFKICGRL